MSNRTLDDWLNLSLDERHHLRGDTDKAVLAATESHQAFISAGESAADGHVDGLLAAIPYSVKDNIDVAGLPTTGGTPALHDFLAPADNGVVSLLRAEGAFIVGKTNLHELALGITSSNTTYGHVRNPVDPQRASGGSSGGSAVSVALGVVPFALGTDTGGSVTVPASMCGIVGFRPTTGRYPADGVVQISSSRDTVGVHANNVRDICTIDDIICPGQPATHKSASDLTIGVPSHRWAGLDEEVDAVCQAALRSLELAGVTLVEVAVPGAEALAAECGFGLVFYEMMRGIAAYTSQSTSGLDFSSIAAAVASPDVGGLVDTVTAQPVSPRDYMRFRASRARLRRLYADAFVSSGIDAFTFPTTPVLPPLLGVDDVITIRGEELPLFPTTIRHTNPGTVAGVPMLSIPVGTSATGLPIGLALEGLFHTDRAVLAAGRVVEESIS